LALYREDFQMNIDIDELKERLLSASTSLSGEHTDKNGEPVNLNVCTDAYDALSQLQAENAELKRNYQNDLHNAVRSEIEQLAKSLRVDQVLAQNGDGDYETLQIVRVEQSSNGVCVIAKGWKMSDMTRIEALERENAELRRELEEARKDADNWNWLASNCDEDAQDDFIQWLARNVADKETINAKVSAARQQQGDDAKG
jgi:hypothetical protein